MKHDFYTNFRKQYNNEFLINITDESGVAVFGYENETFDGVAYKASSSFLKEGLKNFYRLRIDDTMTPRSELFFKNSIFLVTRDVSPDYILDSNVISLSNLYKKQFTYCSFEKVLGLLVDSNISDSDRIIHHYSGGIDLMSITTHAPPDFRSKLSTLLARTFAEIHNSNIIYTDTVPTNMRYDFTGKILLNPHPFVNLKSNNEYDRFRDLAFCLKTHRWIPDKKHFIAEYSREIGCAYKMQTLVTTVNNYIGEIDSNVNELDPAIARFWVLSDKIH